ncbi:MAG: response regulator, partial [Lachnospiraceae bacterium]|nr:response regulator [Lachnospiraceae bacterium]
MKRLLYKRRVLVVEDEDINRQILGNILASEYEVVYARNGQEAWDILHEETSDIALVLLDLLMPVMDGFELLRRLQEDPGRKRIPVIVMTSEKEAEVKSIRVGAADFIAKPYDMPEVILARCERIIRMSEDASLIDSTEKDAVTGLYTRDYFFEYIRQIENHRMEPSDALVFNIDHFHLVNEMYGRSTGDAALLLVAETLKDVLGGHAVISCRTEADTFYVYCEHIEDYTPFIAELQERLGGETESSKIRLRAGIYQNADPEAEAEARFDRAKIACDRIRGDYSTPVAYYSKELHQKSIYHERLIKDIDTAIANEDFKVFFQPKYDISGDTPKLRSAEALIRWQHPELGMISPGDFIPLFESNG